MEKAVCVRDERGRWCRGVSGNPAGRPCTPPERKRLANLLAAAEAAGAEIVLILPEQREAA
jgi:hypothetical protein